MRTLLSDTRTSALRPERRTALVSRELARLDIDIASLSETRLAFLSTDEILLKYQVELVPGQYADVKPEQQTKACMRDKEGILRDNC